MLRRICLQLSSHDELPSNQAYGLSVFLIVTAGTAPGTAAYEQALGVQSLVESAFAGCDRIQLNDVVVVSERELTLDFTPTAGQFVLPLQQLNQHYLARLPSGEPICH